MMKADRFKLFLLGFLTLFLELVLIRYLAGNIWNLGYFPNLVLMGVFIGMGIGFVFHQRWSDQASKFLLQGSVLLLMLLLALIHFARPTVPGFGRAIGQFGSDIFYTAVPTKSDKSDLLIFVFWFVMVVSIFAL